MHELLGVDLAPFQLRRILRGTDDLALGRTELVDDAGDQGNFRSDDGEIGIDRVRRSQVVRGRQKLAEFRDPRIARCAVDLMTFLRQTPGDRVLAAAAADDKNFHETRIFTGELPVYRGKLECSYTCRSLIK